MPTGKIKFYNKDKGYGFIIQDDGGQDLFLHNSSLIDKVQLDSGYEVEYDIERGKQGLEARNVIVLVPDPKTLPPLVTEAPKVSAPAERAPKIDQVPKTRPKAVETEKPEQAKGQPGAKVTPRAKDQVDVRMSVAFMTKQVQTQEPLEFVFLDNEIIVGKLDGFDAYTVKVVTDDNEKFLVHKHALKYVKKIRPTEDEINEDKPAE